MNPSRFFDYPNLKQFGTRITWSTKKTYLKSPQKHLEMLQAIHKDEKVLKTKEEKLKSLGYSHELVCTLK